MPAHEFKPIEEKLDHFAQDFLDLLSRYPDVAEQGRSFGFGVGCDTQLLKKMVELVHTDAELRAVQNLPRLDYRKTHNFNSLEGSHNGIAAVC